jgi:hypothetical protein
MFSWPKLLFYFNISRKHKKWQRKKKGYIHSITKKSYYIKYPTGPLHIETVPKSKGN